MTEKLEVDCFEIDIETLADADSHNARIVWEAASCLVITTVIANLTQDSKRKFEEYQEQNDPCK